MWEPQPLATLRASVAFVGITLPFYLKSTMGNYKGSTSKRHKQKTKTRQFMKFRQQQP
jgi:hypothetical protein